MMVNRPNMQALSRVRVVVLVTAALLAASGAPSSWAQPAPGSPGAPAAAALDASTFVRLAHSSATVQARAAEIAATRETRPEVKAFAQRMVGYRQGQIPKLEAAARENNTAVPTVPQMEHRLILENLEPLDYLALSRRYAEFQTQALEQEIRIYDGAANSSDPWPKPLAEETVPELRRLLDEARAVQQAVGP